MSDRPPPCDQCGAEAPEGSRFCHSCGHPLRREALLSDGHHDVISWETDIRLATNPLVLKQLMLVALGSGLFMAFLLTLILATTGEFRDIPMMLLISLLAAGGLGLLLLLVTLVLFGNRIRVRFTVNKEGALWETVDPRALRGSRLAMLAGVLGPSPQAVGAGSLAVSREKEFVQWSDLSAVQCDERRHTIVLRSSWRPVMMVICLPGNYEHVLRTVNQRVAPAPPASRAGWKPVGRALLGTAMTAAAAAPLFRLSAYPFELDIFLPLVTFLFALATIWLVPLFGWVVMGCAGILAIQITRIGLSEFAWLYGYERLIFFLAYAGLTYLAWLSWRSVRGRLLPLLMET